MSHFTVMIIGEDPEKQLEPFNENTEVPMYVKHTREQLIEKGRKDIKDYENRTYAKYLQNPNKYIQECKNEAHINYLKNDFPLKLEWTDQQVYDDEIQWHEPEDIGDDGETYSTYNPKSKWDWYSLGGRWAGLLKLKEGIVKPHPNFSWGWDDQEKQKVLKENKTDQALKKEIENINDVVTFALLKDGIWYERGEMGWWGYVSDEKEENEWDDEFKKLTKELSEDTLISIYDCHI